MSTCRINGNAFFQMVRLGAERLGEERTAINDLNVFPIPDGDTGDNMYMTIEAGCRAVSPSADISVVSKALSDGMLMGARGNSGVILSRIFAGLSRGLAGKAEVSPSEFAEALACSVEDAYKAVSVPVEGTVLTVLREGVAAAAGDDFETLLNSVSDEMARSLERTPELLDTLKQAGVIDSGGAGLLQIMRGMLDAVRGERASGGTLTAQSSAKTVNIDLFGPDDVLEYGYCTEFLLRLQTSKVDLGCFDVKEIDDYLNAVGDSVVCFREGSMVKVHVHTGTPGEILTHCQRWGEFLTLKVENMTLQHNETGRGHQNTRRKHAVVAVASGKGVKDMFTELGADLVIEGGQTMNPSAGSFVSAFRTVNADYVYVLPNNSNIILTAQQAASMYTESKVYVIPTKTIGAGIIVMGDTDFTAPADRILPEAAELAGSVVCAAVSRAVRDTDVTEKGGFIGFEGAEVLCGGTDRSAVAEELFGKIGAGEYDVAMLIAGADVPAGESAGLVEALQAAYPRMEIIFRNGGQPVYDYLIILQ